MMPFGFKILAVCAFLAGLAGWVVSASAEVILTPQEISQAIAHGPWPPVPTRDVSNRVSGNPAAIALGKALFADPQLSRDGSMSCATCHIPTRDFSEPKPRSRGRVLLDRNTPSLNNLSVHRWFGWGGSSDSIWGQSILPLLNGDEMDITAAHLKQTLQTSSLSTSYAAIFGIIADQHPQDVLVNTAKALAAYQETLSTGATTFDHFRDALQAGDVDAASAYSQQAQRGLKLFLGKGRCVFCHSGPAFTNGEFHDAAVPYFLERGRVDAGRHEGLKTLFESPFNLDGAYNDDPDKSGAWAVRNVVTSHADFGMFRVPSLRGLSRTAPYMHNGSLADLDAVVDHYSQINTERLHADGEAILVPLDLNDQQTRDLITFLKSLSDDPVD